MVMDGWKSDADYVWKRTKRLGAVPFPEVVLGEVISSRITTPNIGLSRNDCSLDGL